MKKIILILVTLFLISCDNAKPNFIALINASIVLNKLEPPIIVYKTPKNIFLGNSKNIILLSAKELLSKKDEKFYSLSVYNYKDSECVYLTQYSSGGNFATIFDKSNHYKVLSNDYIQTKLERNFLTDIYDEIVRYKYPVGLAKKFEREQDSLQKLK